MKWPNWVQLAIAAAYVADWRKLDVYNQRNNFVLYGPNRMAIRYFDLILELA